jgi:glycosyltransferase involved in cell wall biosynthesis
MKSIRPPEGVPHLCYCHSPARYIWEQTDDYAVGSGGGLRQIGLGLLRKPFQSWDRRTASRVTVFLANSRHTAARIKRCYNRDAAVVYPPVRTNFFTPDTSVPRENWLLVVSALEPYKRVDLAIHAAQQLGIPLRIIGDGSQRNALQRLAGEGSRTGDRGKRRPHQIEFLGRVADDVLLDHYRRAAALVFPQVEDFGITAVEAQSTGCPVIAFAAGGALETVTDETGVLFREQDAEHLAHAIDRFFAEGLRNPGSCRANAEQFSEEVFDRTIRGHVDRLLSGKC